MRAKLVHFVHGLFALDTELRGGNSAFTDDDWHLACGVDNRRGQRIRRAGSVEDKIFRMGQQFGSLLRCRHRRVGRSIGTG